LATTPNGYGRFIGRVGGLAVALGIGLAVTLGIGVAALGIGVAALGIEVAIANGTAIASADSQSGSPKSTSADSASSDSTSGGSKGDHKSAVRGPTHGTVTTESSATASTNDDPKSTDAKTSASHEDADDSSSSGRRLTKIAAKTTISQPSSAQTSPVATAPAATAQTVMGQTLAVSPLGTPEQLAAEQRAAATVNTLPVQLMKLVLQFGWMSTARQQFAAVHGPDQANTDALSTAVDEYAMGAAFQQQLLDPMTPTAVMQVAPPHVWYGQDVGGSRILYDNPDTIYRFMGVNKTSSYVITGRFTGEEMPADTSFSVLTGLSGTTASVLTGRQLVVNADGSFTITVSGSPTGPGPNHIQLTSDTTLIAVRNTLSDWNEQDPMSLSIERVSGPPDSLFSQLGGFAVPLIGPMVTNNPLLTTLVSLIPPLADPPPLLRGAVTAVIMALGLQMESKYISVATTDPTTGERRQPNVLTNPTRNAEFLATQLQSAGYFQLNDDQALVVTVDPGNAGYFVVPVTNDWTITGNYWDQQTSLNNAQAMKNADGTYTIVISPQDPDVWNWVSTGGLNQGTISIRFQDLDPNSSTLPTVSSQVVSLDQLAGILPAGTVYASAQDRLDQIALRKSGFNNRFAPYPQP
jgi:hypothetical protein